MNRHFVLIEQTGVPTPIPIGAPPPAFNFPPAQAVLYDSKGEEEPRVIFPQDGSGAAISAATVREDDRQLPAILIQTDANFLGSNPSRQPIWLLSIDGGATWTKVVLPALTSNFIGVDTGGPFIRSRFSNVRIGTREFPFVVHVNGTVYAVGIDGSAKQLATLGTPRTNLLIGSDSEGRRFLAQSSDSVIMLDLNGARVPMAPMVLRGASEGWITPDGAAYIEQTISPGNVILWYAKNGTATAVAAAWDGAPDAPPPINPSLVFFAVPSADYSAAWMTKRGGGRPTQLLMHKPNAGVSEQWRDVSAPEVEALHPGASGDKLLIQVHRPRQTVDQLLFKDPALAVWRVGEPAPRFYDELFLSETLTKGFVHLDVDKIESGDAFVFDSGIPQQPGGGGVIISPAPVGGGGDVVQEWGVVRASLAQKLILPGFGRVPGAFGSSWVTDVTFYNAADAQVNVNLRFTPNGDAPRASAVLERTLTFEPKEIRLISDALQAIFGLEVGNGALLITPEAGAGINVTSRTYTRASNGSYGYSMNGIDVFAAAGPRFPVTFAGAFQGANFRTNTILADVSGRGTEATLSAAGPNGPMGSDVGVFQTPALGQQQFNFVGSLLGLLPSETGALVVQPNRGEMIASVFAIDNRTNDPTFFPPDIPASVMRTIPAIGHLDGANGSKFRSDLFLFNNSSLPKTVMLQAKLWDVPENPTTLPLTLLPHEARVIRDVLFTAFGRVGIARLRFTLQGPSTDTSVRVTSRTYTIDPNGGTFGFLMPPLNAFQSGGAGDTLEILGASLDPRLRTNLGLVDLAAFPSSRQARARVEIIDDRGRSLDRFEVSIPSAGGMQINDLFHARGLPESTKPVLLRISTVEGMLGAYGAFVDNGTNDPAYAAANLGAKQ
jgi:hypothetical protein